MIDMLLAQDLGLASALGLYFHSRRIERNVERVVTERYTNGLAAFLRGHLHPATFFLAGTNDDAFNRDRLVGVLPGIAQDLLERNFLRAFNKRHSARDRVAVL